MSCQAVSLKCHSQVLWICRQKKLSWWKTLVRFLSWTTSTLPPESFSPRWSEWKKWSLCIIWKIKCGNIDSRKLSKVQNKLFFLSLTSFILWKEFVGFFLTFKLDYLMTEKLLLCNKNLCPVLLNTNMSAAQQLSWHNKLFKQETGKNCRQISQALALRTRSDWSCWTDCQTQRTPLLKDTCSRDTAPHPYRHRC